MIGNFISHYKILEKLGEGGMGVVYKAHDTKLDRIVALKFLPHHLTSSEEDQARFLQEAKAASQINHPNVCTIFDIKEEDDEQFIVMEYVDGETLREKIVRTYHDTSLQIDNVIRYAVQNAEAIHAAHSKSIIHRDIKSENIMINSNDQIKVMDFGLAKLKGSLHLTRTSSTVGTLAYMSPEQIQGSEVDTRSDIFSFGVVFYEMLTGKFPFRGEHEASMMYEILNSEPLSITTHRQEVDAELERIVMKCLKKEREERYQTMQEIISNIKQFKGDSTEKHISQKTLSIESPQIKSVQQKSKRIKTAMALVGTVFIIAAAVYFFFMMKNGDAIDSLAVLPFTNASADSSTEYLSDGITESLINSLSKLPKLKVISMNSVLRYKGQKVNLGEIGRELGVRAVMVGKIIRRGDGLFISAELVDTREQTHLWGEQYNRKLADIFVVQEEISKEISDNLRLRLSGEEAKKLTKRYTENPEAYDLYLKGRYFWKKYTKDGIQKGLEFFKQATDRDPSYALAYTGLADSYSLIAFFNYDLLSRKDAMQKAREATMKALELDDALSEAHASLGYIKRSIDWDWRGAEQEYRRAIELNPKNITALELFSLLLAGIGRSDEAVVEMKKALELDPFSVILNLELVRVYSMTRQYELAIEQSRKVIELDSTFAPVHSENSYSYEMLGKKDEAVRELITFRKLSSDSIQNINALQSAYRKEGWKGFWQKYLELRDLTMSRQSTSVGKATILIRLGRIDEAFAWLEKAYDEHQATLLSLNLDPIWDPVRSDPRFIALLKRLGFEK